MAKDTHVEIDSELRRLTRSSYEIFNVQFENDDFTVCKPSKICSFIQDSEEPHTLVKYNEVPPFLKGNPFVMSGYRVHFSGSKCLKSICKWTNETLNIWTHLFGFSFFFVLTLVDNLFRIPLYKGSITDHIIVSIGLVCFQFCMLSSAGYHIFVCHSERACRRWLSIDLTGICIGLIGCYIPAVHFAFYCLSIWRDIYLLVITVLSVIVLGVQLHSRFVSTDFWRIRVAIYLGLAGFGVIPTIHWVYLNDGFSSEVVQMFFHKVIVVYMIGLLAFFFYVTKFPERMFPGKMDFVGSSHQLWHVTVVIAFAYWHQTGSELLLYRTKTPCFS